MSTHAYRATIKELRRSRQGWIDILLKAPDSVEAAQHLVTINAKIELLNTMRYGEGDYEPIE